MCLLVFDKGYSLEFLSQFTPDNFGSIFSKTLRSHHSHHSGYTLNEVLDPRLNLSAVINKMVDKREVFQSIPGLNLSLRINYDQRGGFSSLLIFIKAQEETEISAKWSVNYVLQQLVSTETGDATLSHEEDNSLKGLVDHYRKIGAKNQSNPPPKFRERSQGSSQRHIHKRVTSGDLDSPVQRIWHKNTGLSKSKFNMINLKPMMTSARTMQFEGTPI